MDKGKKSIGELKILAVISNSYDIMSMHYGMYFARFNLVVLL
jgi:hypothetical protein